MSTLLYGMVREEPPADQNVVRSTAPVVEHDAPPAEYQGPPQMEDVQTDPNPHLGMVNRQLAPDYTDSEQYAPWHAADVDDAHLLNDRINRQVSSSGTAAAREAAGRWGHGTAPTTIGIEPTRDLAEGGKMTNEYFKVDKPDIQSTMSNSMSLPLGTDGDARAEVMMAGKAASLDAASAGMYQAFYANLMGR